MKKFIYLIILSILFFACDNSGLDPVDGILINSLNITPRVVTPGSVSNIEVEYTYNGTGILDFDWDTNGGRIEGTGSSVQWRAPSSEGNYAIELTLSDGIYSDYAATTIYCGDSDPCDPTDQVVIGGRIIPDYQITRDSYGCVIELDMHAMGLTDENCLAGLEFYAVSLEILDLSDNQLNSLNLDPVYYCRQLKTLDLSDNYFNSIDLSPLDGCLELEYLSLASNNLFSLSLDAIQFTDISTLILEDNLLSYVDLSPFVSLSSIYDLDISGNQLTLVETSYLGYCYNLDRLDLSDNNLTDLDLSPFDGSIMSSIHIDENYFSSSMCEDVCSFIDDNPSIIVYSDCSCF